MTEIADIHDEHDSTCESDVSRTEAAFKRFVSARDEFGLITRRRHTAKAIAELTKGDEIDIDSEELAQASEPDAWEKAIITVLNRFSYDEALGVVCEVFGDEIGPDGKEQQGFRTVISQSKIEQYADRLTTHVAIMSVQDGFVPHTLELGSISDISQ